MDAQEINGLEFVKSRSTEIQEIENAILSNNKKTMLFQRLPFYKRRRTTNYDKRKNKKQKQRKRNRHPLRTHVWHAKRFFMLKVWSVSLPLKRRVKSDSFVYKSQHRGFLVDESYKKVSVYEISDTPILNIDFSCKNVVQNLQWRNELGEAVVTDKYIVNIGLEDSEILNLFNESYKLVGHIDCCISVLKKDDMFEHLGTADKLMTHISYIPSLGNNESGKILCSSTLIMNLWQKCFNSGLIPLSIMEQERLALENSYLLYPYDYVNSPAYKSYEQKLVGPIIAKYERTPRSKRMAYDTSKLYLYTTSRICYAGFVVNKGTVERAAEIYSDHCIIGKVIRGAFCFSKGKCAGVCFFFRSVTIGSVFKVKNLTSPTFNQMLVTEIYTRTLED